MKTAQQTAWRVFLGWPRIFFFVRSETTPARAEAVLNTVGTISAPAAPALSQCSCSFDSPPGAKWRGATGTELTRCVDEPARAEAVPNTVQHHLCTSRSSSEPVQLYFETEARGRGSCRHSHRRSSCQRKKQPRRPKTRRTNTRRAQQRTHVSRRTKKRPYQSRRTQPRRFPASRANLREREELPTPAVWISIYSVAQEIAILFLVSESLCGLHFSNYHILILLSLPRRDSLENVEKWH